MPLPITSETINDVGLHILNGMTEREACTLADVDFNQLQEEKENSEILRKFIDKKHVEFKANHLKEIQKNKSEKNSMWLLEKLRPEEFGSKARSHDGPTINIMQQIIREIQHDDQNIITISRGNRSPQGEQSDNINTEPKLVPANILG